LPAKSEEASLNAERARDCDYSRDAPVVTGVSNESASRKRQNGVYYTPSDVAALLCSWAIRSKDDTVLEPSFGGCAFLEAAVKRLASLGASHPLQQIRGCDVDPLAFDALRQLDPGLAQSKAFRVGDFLSFQGHDSFGGTVDVVIGNPPFVAYRRMNAEQRGALESWLLLNESKTPKDVSLWAYFLQHSLKFLKVGGRMAWVLPSSILHVRYGKRLQDLLSESFSTVTYLDVREQLFVDSGTSELTVLVFCEGYKPKIRPRSVANVVRVDSLQEAIRHTAHRDAPLSNPDTTDEATDVLATFFSKNPHTTLGELGKILIGDVVGDTNFFVRTFAEWSDLGVPQRDVIAFFVKSALFSGVHLTTQEVEALTARNARCVLLRPSDEDLCQATSDYIGTYPPERIGRVRTFGKRTPWYLVSHDPNADAFFPCLSTVAPRLIVNTARVACGNSLYRVHLRPESKRFVHALAVHQQTTVGQLSCEILGAGLAQGALKLNPSHVREVQYAIAALGQPATKTFTEVNQLLVEGKHRAATIVADRWLATATSGFPLERMQSLLARLRKRRHPRDLHRQEH
jgi:adenine-specific DNA-methyltransferase